MTLTIKIPRWLKHWCNMALRSASSSGMRAGTPSMITPSAGPWDSPKVGELRRSLEDVYLHLVNAQKES